MDEELQPQLPPWLGLSFCEDRHDRDTGDYPAQGPRLGLFVAIWR